MFVAPSITTRKWEEQVGMANLQAMACGVPVVSTRSGAIPGVRAERRGRHSRRLNKTLKHRGSDYYASGKR